MKYMIINISWLIFIYINPVITPPHQKNKDKYRDPHKSSILIGFNWIKGLHGQ